MLVIVLIKVNLSMLDLSEVKSMSKMFYDMKGLCDIDISSFSFNAIEDGGNK